MSDLFSQDAVFPTPLPPTPKTEELRPYQLDVLERARGRVRPSKGILRGIIQCATGGGKTHIQCELARATWRKNKRCLLIADRRKLVGQISKTLDRFEVPYGVIMRDETRHTHYSVIVASKDTLAAWQRNNLEMPAPFDVLIQDECHKCPADVFQGVLKMWPNAVSLGFTATPADSKGRRLNDYYQFLECSVPTSELVRQGWLIKPEVYAPLELLSSRKKGKKTQGLAGDPVSHWRRHADGMPTIGFAGNRAESIALCDKFNAAGIPAEHIDSRVSTDEAREEYYRRLQTGKTLVLCSVGLLIEGVDFPGVSCAILWRKFGSLVMFHQGIGRIMRPHPGKTRAVVLDHCGACGVHGLPGEDIAWSLDDLTSVDDRRQAAIDAGDLNPPIACRQCGMVFSGAAICPACGWKPKKKDLPPQEAKVVATDELLVRYAGEEGRKILKEDQQKFWKKMLGWAANEGRSAGVAASRFKLKFGVLPWDAGVHPLPKGAEWKSPAAELFPQLVNRRNAK